MPLPITKIAFVESTTPDTARLHAALMTLCRHTRLEPGCLQFTFFHADHSRSRIVLFESFRDQAALDVHMREAHTQAFFQQKLVAVSKLHNLEELTDDQTP